MKFDSVEELEKLVTDLDSQIAKKEMELHNLMGIRDELLGVEKRKVLQNKKAEPMEKTKYLLGFEFESASSRTPQYLEFHKVFKKEFMAMLKPIVSEMIVSKPNHFDVTGFFKTVKGNIYYFSLEDLRWDKETMMYRTAKDFKDYTGGSNCTIKTSELEKFVEIIKGLE